MSGIACCVLIDTNLSKLIISKNNILKMKKNYYQPATEVAQLQTTAGLLTGSPAIDPAGAPGVNAGRSGYGDANIGAWD